jgi:hypothetical protein
VAQLFSLGALAHPTKTQKKNTMKTTIQTLKLGLAAFLFAMTSSTLLAAPPHTGIQGQAVLYISYGTPVEEEPGVWLSVGDVQLPVTTSFSVFSARAGHARFGHELGRFFGHFSTDANGAFSIPLPPGKYVVVPDALRVSAFPFAQSISTDSFEVTVRARKLTPTLILYYQDGPLSLTSMLSP